MKADPKCETCEGTGEVIFTRFDTEILSACHCTKTEYGE